MAHQSEKKSPLGGLAQPFINKWVREHAADFLVRIPGFAFLMLYGRRELGAETFGKVAMGLMGVIEVKDWGSLRALLGGHADTILGLADHAIDEAGESLDAWSKAMDDATAAVMYEEVSREFEEALDQSGLVAALRLPGWLPRAVVLRREKIAHWPSCLDAPDFHIFVGKGKLKNRQPNPNVRRMTWWELCREIDRNRDVTLCHRCSHEWKAPGRPTGPSVREFSRRFVQPDGGYLWDMYQRAQRDAPEFAARMDWAAERNYLTVQAVQEMLRAPDLADAAEVLERHIGPQPGLQGLFGAFAKLWQDWVATPGNVRAAQAAARPVIGVPVFPLNAPPPRSMGRVERWVRRWIPEWLTQ